MKQDRDQSLVHYPVMVNEALSYLNLQPGMFIVDCTVGAGGHAQEIVSRILPHGFLVGIDQDDRMVEEARRHLARFEPHVELVCDSFRHVADIVAAQGRGAADGMLFDLGVASPQIADPERGFSFSVDGPLDMRMDRRRQRTAADVVNHESEQRLVEIIRTYGEERFARRIARRIVQRRGRGRIRRTLELASIVAEAAPRWERRIHPATRTFQALRIEVNDELRSLEDAMAQVPGCLKSGGRVVVVSFHSLEDRIVKQAFKRFAAAGEMKILTRRVVRPTEMEIEGNPRSRSARLRAAEKEGS
ncbi:MAG: 16S rRNA (cytosine(1402)-N(4))-methyltransferase RsmH [Planctomycetota bacterium]